MEGRREMARGVRSPVYMKGDIIIDVGCEGRVPTSKGGCRGQVWGNLAVGVHRPKMPV